MLVALAGLKGGTGKTTFAVNLGVEWASRGAKVLFVDLDPSRGLKRWSDGALAIGRTCPTTLALGGARVPPTALRELALGFDLTIVDTPPANAELLEEVIRNVDVTLVPLRPHAQDLWGLRETWSLLVRCLPTVAGPRAYVVLADDPSASNTEARALLGDLGAPVLDTVLHADRAWSRAMTSCSGVTEHSPTGAAATCVRDLVDELQRRSAPPTLH